MTRAVVAAVLPNIVKWIEGCLREGPVPTGDGFPRERTIEELEDKMRLSMENGAYEMARQIGELKKKAAAVTLSDWHRVMPHDALDWIKGYVPKLVGVLEEDILRKVRDEVTAGMAQGKTADEVTAAVEAHVNGFAKHRVETIARTESMRAYSMGAVITLRQTPDASGVEYCSILDDRTTMECQERDGMRLRIDDPRVIYNTPPLHPNCRSVLIPILGDEVPGDWKGDPEKADLLATEHPTIQREVDIEAVRRAWGAGESKPALINLQFFAFDPEKERERIRSGYYGLKISAQKQARHTEGTKEYERYQARTMDKHGKMPSVLYGGAERAKDLVEKYAGTGTREPALGTEHPVETVRAQEIVGAYWSLKLGRYIETHWLRLRYTKENVHCYPVWGGGNDD